ncbi:MAG: hypothetical protein ACRDL1_05210 [Solirubrobacterales bacterium]
MGRLLFLSSMVAVGLALAIGCGGDEQVPDDEIVDALKLESKAGQPVYAMGGDPFCEVDENLLNDSGEIETASESDDLGLVITDSDESVGIRAVPPFDPECGREARRALDELE